MWYYNINNISYGPVSESTIVALFSRQAIREHTPVYTQGMSAWIPLWQSRIAPQLSAHTTVDYRLKRLAGAAACGGVPAFAQLIILGLLGFYPSEYGNTPFPFREGLITVHFIGAALAIKSGQLFLRTRRIKVATESVVYSAASILCPLGIVIQTASSNIVVLFPECFVIGMLACVVTSLAGYLLPKMR